MQPTTSNKQFANSCSLPCPQPDRFWQTRYLTLIFMALFLDGVQLPQATVTSRRQFTFYHSVPRNSWYSFYRPRKDEGLSRRWSHPVVLNTGPQDWESSALTTRPLLCNN